MASYPNKVVNIGAAANDDTGDTLRAGMDKFNDNNISLRGALDWDASTFNAEFSGELLVNDRITIDEGGLNSELILSQSSVERWKLGNSGAGTIFRIRDEFQTTDRLKIDADGNLLIGASTGSNHIFSKSAVVDSNNLICKDNSSLGASTLLTYAISATGFNAANAAIKIGKDGVTNRSANAAGTLNASGADYAEYEHKSSSCGDVSKGDIIGFNIKGLITDKFSEAISFMIKSSDPAYVGGDVWGDEDALGLAQPEQPIYIQPEYEGINKPKQPIKPEFRTPFQLDGESDEEFAGVLGLFNRSKTELEANYNKLLVFYNVNKPKYDAYQAEYKKLITAAKTKHTTAMKKYKTQMNTFEAKLEEARQTVDRIAYAGKVPVNGLDNTNSNVGDYVIAVDDGSGGIKAESLPKAGINSIAEMLVAESRVGTIKSYEPDQNNDGDITKGRAVVIVKAG